MLGDIVTAVDRLVVRMFVSRADQIEQDSVGSAGSHYLGRELARHGSADSYLLQVAAWCSD